MLRGAAEAAQLPAAMVSTPQCAALATLAGAARGVTCTRRLTVECNIARGRHNVSHTAENMSKPIWLHAVQACTCNGYTIAQSCFAGLLHHGAAASEPGKRAVQDARLLRTVALTADTALRQLRRKDASSTNDSRSR